MKRIINILLLFIFNIGFSQTESYSPNLDGSRTFYKTFGKGEPILIINGGPGMNSEGFSYLAQQLAKENQTIIYDQRGTGKSVLKELNSKTITMKAMVDDIESLRKHLNIKKWTVLGHSFGGMLASYYATLYPNSIDKIILSASGGVDLGLTTYVSQNINNNLTQIERDSLAYYNTKIDRGNRSKANLLGRGRALAPAYLYNKKNIPTLAERLTQGNAALNQLVWDDLQKIKFDCKPQLKNFLQPVLIIQGKQDIIKAETAEIAHQALKNSKVILLDNCGHYGWLDTEEAYFKAIFDFLKS
ncbi:alpha/beta fold hydrolase [Flavobacterium amnicola]|uniref:Alpha/beta fold hydrolase n=1 Tax=Flavobacterium amnicola TaxID=2506422 RepID=A0A4Q1K895_9FLAO|nr:alpha/beta fold hydrolase [Flavobacterium amnicola]RXR20799.1 alpha/beta fold hydrolase [Flavobacterium amnicola]